MVSLTGNTGPYVQYAAARVRSIFRSAGVQIGVGEGDEARRIVIGDPAERALALALLEFGSVAVSYTHLDVYKRQAQSRAR